MSFFRVLLGVAILLIGIGLGATRHTQINRWLHATWCIFDRECTYTPTSVQRWTDRKHVDVSLRGSQDALNRALARAKRSKLRFVETESEIRGTRGLVRVEANSDLTLRGVSHPYVLPTTSTFLTRLAAQYRGVCGEQLVVTSALRPRDEQPRNASPYSVHPVGMAVDLRIPRDPECRRWLARTLLILEARNVIEATEELRPAHYHIAVFPLEYRKYVAYRQARRQ